MIGFINTLYIHTTRDYRQYSAIAILHTLQVTVTHSLGFSVLTSRILATDLTQSHCHFTSHMVSFVPLSSLLAIILQLPTQFISKLIFPQAGISNSTHHFLNYSTFVLYSYYLVASSDSALL
jgi:hypothetical protein